MPSLSTDAIAVAVTCYRTATNPSCARKIPTCWNWCATFIETFVEQILAENQETLDRRYALKAEGMTVSDVAERVARVMGLATEQVWLPGKYKQQIVARSLLCYWSVRELGECMTGLSKRLGISTAAVSKAVRRGAQIAKDRGLKFIN